MASKKANKLSDQCSDSIERLSILKRSCLVLEETGPPGKSLNLMWELKVPVLLSL